MSRPRKRTMNRNLKLPKIPKNWQDNPLLHLPRVEVEWMDATAFIGWRTWDDAQGCGLSTIKTVGYLAPPTKTTLRVVPTLAANGDIGDVWLIPLAWVQKVRRLK